MNHPFLADDPQIRWSTLTPDHVEADINHAIELAETRLQVIRDLSADAVTYDNTFVALENATEELGRGWGRLNHLDSVSNNEAQREALNLMLPKVSAFFSSISLDPKIWASLKAFSESSAVESLTAIQKRFVEETCQDFIQSGADLDDEKKARVTEVDAKLSEITQKYSENTLDSTNAWELIVHDGDRLAGIPEMFTEGARLDALAKGHGSEDDPKWRFTLQYPSYYPVLQHADSDDLRKEIWQGLNTIGLVGEWDNTDKVWDILKYRQEKAEILGEKHFPDMILKQRMSKNGETALKFVEDLHAKVKSAFHQDEVELQAYKAKKTGSEPAPLEPWEGAYWSEKMRIEEYDFDEQELRPYFEVSQVMKGMFDIFSKVFNIRIEERDTCFGEDKEGCVQVWHEECSYYDLYDGTSEQHLGSFYADWHPRESKRGGAWMNSLKTGGPQADGSFIAHVGLIIGNMTKPVGDKPALLDHREVETIFHEFGHLLHHLLANITIKSLSGTNVPWDFVELPSQILENWCWDRESLDMFARHYETGEVIPEELFNKMIAAKNFRSGTVFMRQLTMGKLDLELHINLHKYVGRDLDEIDTEILKDYRMATPTKGPSVLRKFGHLFSGAVAYASGYYSYKWSEVLDADAFTRFQKEGIFNEETGMDFRKKILAVGNSRPVDESYRQFMGRDPELAPLLVRSGIEV